MAEQKRERRKGVRLNSKKSSATSFNCAHCDTLPSQALVADVSENGVRLLFDWPEGAAFPLLVGDGMGFQLQVENGGQGFELWSIVRRIDPRDRQGRVGVGIEFSGLDSTARSVIHSSMISMAMTKLRAWRSDEKQDAATASVPMEDASRRKAFADSPLPAAAPAPAPAPPIEPAGVPGHRRKLFLGEILIKQGALDPQRFGSFLAKEFTGHRPLGQELMAHGLATDAAIARALAEQARLAYADPATTAPDTALAAKFPRHIFIKHRCLPIREDSGALVLAVASPPDLAEQEALTTGLGRRVRFCIAPESAMARWRKKIFNEDAPAGGTLRFPAQLRAEYRFMDSQRRAAVDLETSFGLTREISATGLLLAGPLPAQVTLERISDERLLIDVQVDCPSLRMPMNLGCTPLGVEPGAHGGEHLISCRIDTFPQGDDLDWARVCLVHGTHRFRPQNRGRTNG